MPISHVTKLFGTADAKISKLLTDPAGGAATYDTPIDVPGIKSVSLGGEIRSVQLRGDNTLLDSDSSLQTVTVTFNYAKLDLDALAVFLGGNVADTGVQPNQKATFSRVGTDAFNYFKFEAQVTGVDTVGGDGHIIIYKAKLSEFPQIGTAEEDYQTFAVTGVAVPLISTGAWFDIELNETASAISA